MAVENPMFNGGFFLANTIIDFHGPWLPASHGTMDIPGDLVSDIQRILQNRTSENTDNDDNYDLIYAVVCNAMQCSAMQCNAMQCNVMQCSAM